MEYLSDLFFRYDLITTYAGFIADSVPSQKLRDFDFKCLYCEQHRIPNERQSALKPNHC